MKIETETLKRLGPVPFWRGERRCVEELERIYKKAREMVESKHVAGNR